MLHALLKTSFVDFVKESWHIVIATKDYLFCPYPTLHTCTFLVAVKSHLPHDLHF